ncbi:MAG TPA: hypothetical protein P5250_07065, partial [Bacteroidales bacterium]|nr:hypothetical protein [Bacteroidales bacterium]
MKNFYSANHLIIFILLLYSYSASSQLQGTYTIGGTSPNYASISAAVTALNTQGISNSVIFNIRPGTYTEQITLNTINGASATKTVTFQAENGDSTSVIISYPSSTTNTNNFTIKLNGSDYITFKKLTIKRSGTNDYSQVIDISGGATHNKFTSCQIIGNTIATSATYAALVGSTNAADDSYNEFISNLFEGGSYGMYYLGRGSTMLDKGLIIKNNTFYNNYYRAMYITAQDSPEIINNIINASASSSSYQGIYAFYCDNALKIIKNKISISNGGIGVYIHNSSGSATQKGLIANNFISVGGSTEADGIYIYLSSAQHIYYNSINIYSTDATSKSIYINGATVSNLDLRNNNLCSTSGGGYSIYVSDNTITPILSCDYNNLYTTGSYVGYWQTTGNITDLTSWKTISGFDSHSVSTDPLYISTNDLHSQSSIINNAGTSSLSSATPVTDDIDNQPRNLVHPDIGADEFSIEDLGICSFNIIDTICFNTTFSVNVYIKNYSLATFTGNIPLYYKYNNNPTVNETTSVFTIQAGDSILYTFNNQITTSTLGNNILIAGTAYNNDINPNNDESNPINIYVNALPITNINNDTTICFGDSILLAVTGGINYIWNNGLTTSQIHVNPTDTTTYYVTVIDNYGCSTIDSVTVYVNNNVVAADF